MPTDMTLTVRVNGRWPKAGQRHKFSDQYEWKLTRAKPLTNIEQKLAKRFCHLGFSRTKTS